MHADDLMHLHLTLITNYFHMSIMQKLLHANHTNIIRRNFVSVCVWLLLLHV